MTATLRRLSAAALLLVFSSANAGALERVKLHRRVDVKRDCVSGVWSRAGGGVLSNDASPARLRLPMGRVDGSYNLRVEFRRIEGAGPVAIVLVRGNTSFSLVLGTNGDVAEGLVSAEGKSINGALVGLSAAAAARRSDGNDDAKPAGGAAGADSTDEDPGGGAPAVDDRVRLVVKVKPDTVEAIVNGEPFARHRFADGELGVARGCNVGRGAWGLATWGSPTMFSRVELSTAGAAAGNGRADRESGPRTPAGNRVAPERQKRRGETEARRADADAGGGEAGRRHADPLPVGSKWQGARSRINQGDSLRCTMKVVSRRGSLAVLEFSEGGAKYRFALRLRPNGALGFADYLEMGTGAGRRAGGVASGATNGNQLILDYRWMYSDRRVKNRLEQGVIQAVRTK